MEKLTNFCLEPLINHVSSSSVTADGYAPANLVSTNPHVRNKGLRVEHFMRPPTSVDLEFKVPINVACILCKPGLEANSEARFVFTGSHHTTSQKPGCVGDGYEFTLHSGVAIKNTNNGLICLKNRVFQRMWPGEIDFSIETVSIVTGSYMAADLNGAQILEQPLKYPNITSRLRRLKVIVTRLSGVKPFSLKCLEVWGTLPDSCSPLEKGTFLSALQCIKALPASQLPVAMFSDSHQLHRSTLDNAQQRQTNDVMACTDFQSHHDNSVSLPLVPPCFPFTPPTCGTSSGRSNQHNHYHNFQLHGPVAGSQLVNSVRPELEMSPTAGNKRDPTCTSFQASFKHLPTKKARLAETSEPTQDSNKPTALINHSNNSSRGKNSSQKWSIQSNCTSTNQTQDEMCCNYSEESLKAVCTPSKFLDSITYEVMLLPMILPSGHYVDKSTINKLALNDNLYGRFPTDPFTGVPFSAGSQPEFYPRLKIEIDAYLTSCSEQERRATTDWECVGVEGKTVGDAVDIARHMQMLTSSSHSVKKSHPVSCGGFSKAHQEEDPFCSIRQCNTVNCGGNDQFLSSPSTDDRQTVEASDRKSDHVDQRKMDGVSSFEEEVSCSLDNAINKLFSS